MSEARKISVRKILQVTVGLVAMAACIVALQSAASRENGQKVKAVSIEITNGRRYHFLDEQQVKDIIINNRHIDVQDMPIRKLDIHNMERILTANPWVADAQAYLDNQHVLHVAVTQRVPVVRLFDRAGNSYYLDTTRSAIPLSDNYVHYATIVTNVPVLRDDSASNDMKAQILSLVKYIEKDTFWNAQVSQIIIDSANNFELVPVLGNQRIILGDTSDLKDKFGNLFLFYKTVLNKIGWDKYDQLDVRFAGQVLASPSLPYKGPVDKAKAMSNMDWAKSILDNAARQKDDPDFVIDGAAPTAAPVVAGAQGPAQKAPQVMKPVIDHGKKLEPTTQEPVRTQKEKEVKKSTELPAKTIVKKPQPAPKPASKKEIKKETKKDVKKIVKKEPRKPERKVVPNEKKNNKINKLAAKLKDIRHNKGKDKKDDKKAKAKTNTPKYIYQGQ